MATKVEKDALSGTDTTGHEWDGLKELNTPLPKWWLYTFYACIAFSLVWVVVYPAFPIFGARGALDWIAREEPFDRGWYTGPVGWVGQEGAEFAVAIRCAVAFGPRLCIFSGAGIVEGSEPQAEWQEIESKVESFMGALTGR